ncbi:hydantoinase/oxoprolinase family protein [Chelatococcus reniformis]|uniref:Hydantoin utilization protein n=1 Tax=Chelatococcus reniformis TaxID=1494448 RepID=A0A916X9I0_9HYPH|nr:hydantoinase/oxoprolinase family protein [Chelatococcus reniformis]GGC53580.1 hydantoin utilization protein [Chelatococcus reniformis]
MAGWRLGIDIGGTFTDVIAVAGDGSARRSAKVPSRPAEPVRAIVDAIAAVDLSWDEVEEIVHGTTIVTNDIVEQRFRPCALIATRGFSDTIEIGRGSRRHLYRLDLPPRAAPLVAPAHRFEVEERMASGGRVVVDLTEAEIERVVAEVRAAGLDTVAVCLLHAFTNPEHEVRLGAALRRRIANVSLSHELSPEFREFERMSTTVLNAMMMAKIKQHLARIAERKPPASRVHLMHSASGMASPELIAERPLMLAMSGPAAGVSASCRSARELGIAHALTFDMGGTTTDVCLIVDGKAQIAANRDLGGQRIRMPMVAVDSIGAGGGSIARLVSGALVVGPQSAGASPGPACYGQGGERPTVADADLLLGYLNPDRTLGKSVKLSSARAAEVVGRLAADMGFTLVDAAVGIARVVSANMARALRRATVERGLDIRQFDMIAFGGAGPMHAAEVARLCGIGRLVIPAFSSGFSALGCVDATMSYARQLTVNMKSLAWDQTRLDGLLAGQTEALAASLTAAGHGRETLAVVHTAGIRYSGQSYETPITAAALHDPQVLGQQFDEAHRALYGYATGEPWELVSVRTEVSAPERPSEPHVIVGTDAPPAAAAPPRIVTFEDGTSASVTVLDRDTLPVHVRMPGPLVIEDEWSTVIVPPRDTAWMDGRGNLHIAVSLAR